MESKHLKAHNEQKRKENNEYGLYTALHKFQSLGLKSECNGRNSRFKTEDNPQGSPYTTLEDAIVCASKGNEFGLFFTNHIIIKDEVQHLRTVLRHINDTETAVSDFPLICRDATNPQAFATVLTYAERYNLRTLYGFGCVLSEDDDGNSASPEPKTIQQQSNKF